MHVLTCLYVFVYAAAKDSDRPPPLPHQDRDSYHFGEESVLLISSHIISSHFVQLRSFT